MIRILLALACLVAAGSPATAQPGPPPGRSMPPATDGVRPVLYEALEIPDTAGGTARIDVLWRIDESFFIPVKNPEPASGAPFRRNGELLVELVDSSGTTRGRAIRSLGSPASSQEREPAGRSWLTGIETLHVPAGAYTVGIEVSDLESQRRFTDRTRTLRTTPREAAGPSVIGRTWYAEGSAAGRVVLQNFGTDLRFGARGGLAILTRGLKADSTAPLFRYAVQPMPVRRTEDVPPSPVPDRTAGGVVLVTAPKLNPVRSSDTLAYVVTGGEGASDAALLLVPLPLESFQRRPARLTGLLAAGADTLRIDAEFRPLWPDMPVSLRDPEFALDALRHVTTPEQLDSLRSGTAEARQRTLEQFWLPRDPTPGTAMNEVMTEYYRRVDRAITEFATIREPDGSRSDRGRIYILHGPPTRRDRTLGGPEGNQEVWTYDDIARRFIFTDELRNGAYRLISTQSLRP